MIYPCVLLTANRQVVSTAFKSQCVVFVTSGSLKRFSVTDYQLGAADVPNATDCAIEWSLGRVTADGTGTAYSGFMEALETGTQIAPCATVKQGYSAEPTVTASVDPDSGSMNQRGFWRWVAIDKDAEPRAPAVANNGFTLRALSTNYASKLAARMNFRE